MSTLAVSSFSLHRVLGPLHLEERTAEGGLREFAMPLPREHTLEEFVRLVRPRLGVGAVELCQIQLPTSAEEWVAELAGVLADADVRVLTVPIDIGDLGGGDATTRTEDVARI